MEPEIIKRLRSGESLHDNPNFSGSDGEEIVAYVDRITAALAERDGGDEWESVGIGNTWSDYRHKKCGQVITVEMEDSSEEAKRKHVCPLSTERKA